MVSEDDAVGRVKAIYDEIKQAFAIDFVPNLCFTIWANVAHGVVMLIATPIAKGLVMTVVEGLPLFVIAAVLWALRPRRSSLHAVSE